MWNSRGGETSAGLRHRAYHHESETTDSEINDAHHRLHAYVSEMNAPHSRDYRYDDAISLRTRGTRTNSITSEPSLVSTATNSETSWVRPEDSSDWEVPTPSDTDSHESLRQYNFEDRHIFNNMLS